MSDDVANKILEARVVEAEAEAAVCKAVTDKMADKLTTADEEIARLKREIGDLRLLLSQSGISQPGEDKNP